MGFDSKILIVDDSKTALKVMERRLKNLGFSQVQTIGSPKKALTMMKENDYDIVFLDWIMPEMEGIELFKLMKAAPEISETVKVIMLTAENVKDKVISAIQLGVNGYILKPPTNEKIMNQLDRL